LLDFVDSSILPDLSPTLSLIDHDRQVVRAIDCNVHPQLLHEELFREHADDPWLLAATGTSSGTLFRSPRPREKVRALVAGGLSVKRARHRWLTRLKYLSPGDKLVLQSPILGHSEARVE